MDSAENGSVRVAYETGKMQYENFLSNRLHSRNKSLYLPIKSNKFLLFRKKNYTTTSKLKKRMKEIKSDWNLYASLYIASQYRDGNLK